MIGGVILGIVFGAMPGLSAAMAVALCLPISYGMDAIQGIALLIALYTGGVSGGLISAILLKIPGTPSSVATVFDGGPMAARGDAGRALGLGVFFSFMGTMLSVLALVFISPPLADFALKFQYFEYCAIGIFSLSLVSSLVEGSIFKSLMSAVIGFTMTLVGVAPIDGYERFTFGIDSMAGGFNILPALIGFFAVAEVINNAAAAARPEEEGIIIDFQFKGLGFTMKEFVEQIPNMLRSAAIGIGIGILPGIGGGTSNLVAYMTARNMSKYPEKFGTGIPDGIVASETANNASVGGALIPLLALGIPGDVVTAILLGGLALHGLSAGPMLFLNHIDLVYSVFVALFISNIIMITAEYFGMKLFVRVLQVPKNILLSLVMVMCVVGSYGVNNRVFDCLTVFWFGILGYLFSTVGIQSTPFILGFVLGPMVETNLRRGMMLTGTAANLFTQPIPCVFMIATFIVVGRKVFQIIMQGRKKAAA